MRFGQTEFTLKLGDITKEAVDALVTAANSSLVGGGGVDAAIHKAGGPAIMAELRQISARVGKCAAGDAVITGPGKLKAQYVIHAVGPTWAGGKKDEADTLESAYFKSLLLAKEYGAKSIALPAISTGAYGYPVELAAEVALRTCKEFCSEYQCFSELRFVLFTEDAHSAYQKALAALA